MDARIQLLMNIITDLLRLDLVLELNITIITYLRLHLTHSVKIITEPQLHLVQGALYSSVVLEKCQVVDQKLQQSENEIRDTLIIMDQGHQVIDLAVQ